MKIEKNKIVFGGVIVLVLLFIISYSVYIMGDDDTEVTTLKNPEIPELKQEQADYESKLDAINDLKDVKETNAPSIYNEALIDSLGYYDPDLPDKDKERMIESLYTSGSIDYDNNSLRIPADTDSLGSIIKKPIKVVQEVAASVSPKEMALDHQLFFASNPTSQTDIQTDEEGLKVIVDGTQKVRSGYRLKMRLAEPAILNNKHLPKNLPLYGFVSFKPNRALIEIENIAGKHTNLVAYDLQDGSEGIYVVNSFRARATKEVVGDLVDEINIAGVPQVSGIKQLFQRDNRSVTVTILNNYKLILKTSRQ